MTDTPPPLRTPRRSLRRHLIALLVPPLAALTLLSAHLVHATVEHLAADRAAVHADHAPTAPIARLDALLPAGDRTDPLPAVARVRLAEAAALTWVAGGDRTTETAGERFALAPAAPAGSAPEPHAEEDPGHRGLTAGHDRAGKLAHGADAPEAGPWPGGATALLLALLLVATAVALSLRAAARLRGELGEIREEALDIARRRLPSAARRARAGGTVDASAQAPAGHHRADDPLEGVRAALGTVHRAALRGIGDTATARAAGSDDLGPALARLAQRGRHLAELQLSQLDEMEHRTTEPAALGELFRLDHLATRARRQAALLATLADSGAPADDGPHGGAVDVEEVARAAQCEVEDYRRIEVRPSPRAALPGRAAGDLTRVLAELMENATRYSPTHTWVRVTGHHHPLGYAYRIEDRGPGLDAAARTEARERLARAAVAAPGEDRRLGLFVAGRLAARHGVRIDLLPSDNAGLTVEVVVPTALLTVSEPRRNGVGDDASLSA
ncbi:ATP-binding protein [Streptomyces bohaiensis]|uniref:histidine kinase n=1 Tax=Streptomyces bohaiensis TaxID=1431344 RepID=A0ABX1CDL3_9ACTN|nr:sensor histidine kinase [Streptomyces bohaiensis]NJQ16391.1 sensor histidine kinase [Streptomyces bohaiensis]